MLAVLAWAEGTGTSTDCAGQVSNDDAVLRHRHCRHRLMRHCDDLGSAEGLFEC